MKIFQYKKEKHKQLIRSWSDKALWNYMNLKIVLKLIKLYFPFFAFITFYDVKIGIAVFLGKNILKLVEFHSNKQQISFYSYFSVFWISWGKISIWNFLWFVIFLSERILFWIIFINFRLSSGVIFPPRFSRVKKKHFV